MDQFKGRWDYFRYSEFVCKGSGLNEMNPEFIDKLDRLRDIFGYPLIVTSGYRSPEHNMAVSRTGPNGPHTTGRAVDFAVDRVRAFQLLQAVFTMNQDAVDQMKPLVFTGVGVHQRGGGRFIHLDDLEQPEHAPRPTVWTY